MISDEFVKDYVTTLYKAFAENPESVNQFYDEGAVLEIKFESNTIKVSEKYHESLIKGEYTVMRADGVQTSNEISGHATGYVKIDEKFYQSNEMFILTSVAQPKIIYQSSFFAPVQDPGWKPVEIPKPEPKIEPKPEPKPEPKIEPAVEVTDPSQLFYSRSILAQNVPFGKEEALVREKFEKNYRISKFCQARGQVLVEFVNPTDSTDFLHRRSNFNWSGRNIKVKGMPQGFTFKN